MATQAEVLHWQDCILRLQDPISATLLANSGASDAAILEQLLEDAENSTEPALLVFALMTGVTQTEAALDANAAFAQLQFNSYAALGVLNPELGPYEAMGRSLSSLAAFQNQIAGDSPAEVIHDFYILASGGVTPGDAQVNHFLAQYNYFVDIFTDANIPLAQAQQEALGAVVGQIIGVWALQEGSNLDSRFEQFVLDCIEGTANFGGPLPPLDTSVTLFLTDDAGELLQGTPYDDIFAGDTDEIDSSDTLLGYEGFDTADLRFNGSAFTAGEYSVIADSVEYFILGPAGNAGGSNYYFSFEDVVGMERLRLEDFNNGQDLYLFDLQNNVDFYFDDFSTGSYSGAGDVYIYFENGAVGEGATLNLNIFDSYFENFNVYTYGDDFFSELIIEANGNVGEFDLNMDNDLANDDTLTRLVLTGSGDYIYFYDDDGEFDYLEEADFSGFSGDTYLELDSEADLTFTGGSGDDYLDFDSGFDENDDVDGGDGDDTLEVDADEAVNVTGANVQNVEHLRIDGSLTADTVLNNSAGFVDIALQDDTTNDGSPGGTNLVLNGFETVIIEDDQDGLLSIGGVNQVDIIIDDPYDNHHEIDNLEVGEVLDVYIYFAEEQGGQDTYIGILDIETDVIDTDTLTIAGEGDFEVDDVDQDNGDPLQLVDASAFAGEMVWQDFVGEGTDWLIGDLQDMTSSRIENSNYDEEEAEFVLSGADNDWFLYIEDFQAVGAGSRDTLDLGQIATSIADLSFDDLGAGNWEITANGGQFAGTIVLDTDGASLAEIQARIEFDGALG